MMLSTALVTSVISITPIEPAAAQSSEARSFNIPSQALSSALRQFADQSGMQLAYRTEDLRGMTSRGFTGSAPSAQVLARLLAGTGVSYNVTAANTVTIARASAGDVGSVPEGTTSLGPIDVQGEGQGGGAQSPIGPGVGYLATRSASGTKSDAPILETPQAISVVTRKQMDDQQAQTVSEALRYTPGVLSEATGINSRTDTIFARGFQPDQYLDGLRLYGGYSAIDPWGLERVEYVRGPASVLYGQISPGGLINLVSKRPTSDPLHVVELQTGSYNRLQTAFDFSGPLNKEGTLLYRLNGVARRSDGQVDFSRDERLVINPSFTWRPDLDTSLTILASYQHNPSNPTFQQLPAVGTVLPNPLGRISRSLNVSDPFYDRDESTYAHIGYSFDHRFNDTVKFISNFRYSYTDRDSRFLYPDFLDLTDNRTLNRYAQSLNSQTNTLGADNRVQLDFGTGIVGHTVVAGVDYQNLGLRGREGYIFNDSDPLVPKVVPSLDVFNPVYGVNAPVAPFGSDTRQTQQQLGVYAQDTIKIDRLRLIGGIRQDWANSRTKDELSTNPTSKQNDAAFTYRVGALYLFDNGVAPYVSYATSFQPQAGFDALQKPFVPTTGQQTEVGVKYQPVGYDSFITVAAFDLTQQNVLTPDPDPDPTHRGFSVQTGEVRSRGVEFEAHAKLTDQFSLIASYAYQDVKTTKDNGGLVGKTPVRVPRQTASIWANYDIVDQALAGVSLGGGIRYVGDQYGDVFNSYMVPSFTLVDARLAYDFKYLSPSLKGMSAALNVSNLFDKTYVAACIYSAGGCYYGQGRTVLATLTYKW